MPKVTNNHYYSGEFRNRKRKFEQNPIQLVLNEIINIGVKIYDEVLFL